MYIISFQPSTTRLSHFLMIIKKFFSMDASTTARVLTVFARLGFILALAVVVIGFCLWFFSDDYSNKKFIGIFMMREFFPYIFASISIP